MKKINDSLYINENNVKVVIIKTSWDTHDYFYRLYIDNIFVKGFDIHNREKAYKEAEKLSNLINEITRKEPIIIEDMSQGE